MNIDTIIQREKTIIAEHSQQIEEKIAYCRSLLPKLVNHLRDEYHVSQVILIGSLTDRAWRFTLESDIDVVVKGLNPALYIKAWKEVNEIAETGVGVRVDLIDWNSTNHYLKTITNEWGEILYERC